MHILPPVLVRADGAGDFLVRVIAKAAAGRCRVVDLGVRELPEFFGECGNDELLTLVIGPVVARNTAQAHAFAAHAVAG
jgi:hypothetical protein